jgi:RNA recognition motif-containing protein
MTTVNTTDTKVFVGGLSPHTTEQSLAAYFGRFGEIDEVKIVMDRQTGRSKGYGFVSLFLGNFSFLWAIEHKTVRYFRVLL